ncbi:MAG: phosphatase PAP2 family protein [Bacteroidota bacterium]
MPVIDLLYSIDTALFTFINQTISNPLGDLLWPLITHYDRFLVVRILLLAVWIGLLFRGGPAGRRIAILLIPVLFVADQLSSSVLKELIGRPRPCHVIDGVPVVEGIRLLVDCGPGKSFPSSHAVNNFAVGTLFSFYYRKWIWAFMAWASLVALSRPAVGVHYPSDIVGGAIVGALVAMGIIQAWLFVEGRLKKRGVKPARNGEGTQ